MICWILLWIRLRNNSLHCTFLRGARRITTGTFHSPRDDTESPGQAESAQTTQNTPDKTCIHQYKVKEHTLCNLALIVEIVIKNKEEYYNKRARNPGKDLNGIYGNYYLFKGILQQANSK